MNTIFNELPFKNLIKICKINHIHHYSKLNKANLALHIYHTFSARKIQRLWLLYLCSNNKEDNIPIDPINMETITFPCFRYHTKIGKLYLYNIDNLVECILVSGKFRDPLTREDYTDNDLKNIDLIYRVKNKKSKNVYKSKYSRKYIKMKILEEDILVAERYLLDIAEYMKNLIDNDEHNISYKLETLLTNYFPNYLYYFHILYRLNSETANIILENSKSYIEQNIISEYCDIFNNIIVFFDSIYLSYF